MRHLVLLIAAISGTACVVGQDEPSGEITTIAAEHQGNVVDCSAALDGLLVRTCTLGAVDACTAQAGLQATQVVRSTAVVQAVVGTAATFDGKAIYKVNAAEAKLLADMQHMHVLLSSSGTPASSAFEYTSDGAPFIYANPITGMSLVTKTSANDSIARVLHALSTSASTCTQFRVASTDGITPVPVSFVCESTATATLLACDGTQPQGLDFASGASTIVNGVELNFVKTGCGAFRYDVVNNGDTSASVSSSITGIALNPACNFGLAAGGDGYCSAANIAGPVTVVYSGTVTRGGVHTSFNLPVAVRCTKP